MGTLLVIHVKTERGELKSSHVGLNHRIWSEVLRIIQAALDFRRSPIPDTACCLPGRSAIPPMLPPSPTVLPCILQGLYLPRTELRQYPCWILWHPCQLLSPPAPTTFERQTSPWLNQLPPLIVIFILEGCVLHLLPRIIHRGVKQNSSQDWACGTPVITISMKESPLTMTLQALPFSWEGCGVQAYTT